MNNTRLLLSVKDALITFDKEPLFKDLSFNIHEGARIALVGKNGAGKSTLMNIITGTKELDDGERWEENGVTIGYLHQDITPKEGETVFDYIFTEIKEEDKELHAYKVEIVTDALQIDPSAQMTVLSGGQLRRAGLARALVEEPDILLLDEPTNHLDLEIIQWLENYLRNYRGTLLCISHDRTFLANITNQIFWLDRGKIKTCPKGFGHFEEWSAMLLEQEERELKNRKAMVAQEVEWASRGVKARRKRNVRRVEQMKIMREQLKADQSAYRRAIQKIELKPLEGTEENAKVVAEFYNVSKSFKDDHGNTKQILDKFSYRIQRGDRIGILGKNGSGKTTFLKLLID
ncbi:MAG: ABC-F family ATP-binding cassette domain-containing protein, partial [Bdellovibrionales bacterium]